MSADAAVGRTLARREVLVLLGGSAGAAALAASGWWPRRALAAGDDVCVVRPEQTEGPFFVDERLERSDIRADPGDGAVRPGVPLALTFSVSRTADGACMPLPGAVVDVWHCDAAGAYSDVRDGVLDTRGQRFLRGFQTTGANGVARFRTIYPGWYPGRAVHVHFKVRVPQTSAGVEFTSQVYFDDVLTDAVHAHAPYLRSGTRTRNATDGIFAAGGDRLLLDIRDDGAGGYAATFAIALADVALPATTTTTLPVEDCRTVATCVDALASALPDPTTAPRRQPQRVARKLARRLAGLRRALAEAALRSGRERARQYARAKARLAELAAISRRADARGTLRTPLAPVEAAIAALLEELP